MNKVVNINISGVLFVIDEQAYDKLSDYISNLKKYFSQTPGGEEIIFDIESRIAELLLTLIKDKSEIVTFTQVENVINRMGNPAQLDQHHHEDGAKQTEPANEGHKKLTRDSKNEMIGGVCAGIARYFAIDQVLVRGLFLIAFFVFGSGVLLYLVLWIIMPDDPSSKDEQSKTRKLFRDKDNSVLGGVCSGIAAYFGVDQVWIRLLFLVAFFAFGTGILIYIILWAIVPKAITASDKLQMHGIPVDVNSIEKKVKETFAGSNDSIKNGADAVIKAVKKSSNTIHPLVSNLINLCIRLTGFGILSIALLTIVFTIILLTAKFDEFKAIQDFFNQAVSPSYLIQLLQWGTLVFVGSIIFQLLFLGFRLLFRLKVISKWITIITSSIGTIGFVLIIFSVISYLLSVDESAQFVKELHRSSKQDTIYLHASNRLLKQDSLGGDNRLKVRMDDQYDVFRMVLANEGIVMYHNELAISKNNQDSVFITAYLDAYGSSKKEARHFAAQIDVQLLTEGKHIYIDESIWVPNQDFKFQQVTYEMQIPEGTILIVDDEILNLLNRHDAHEGEFEGGNTLMMTKGKLICINCKEDEETDTEKESYIDITIGKDDAYIISSQEEGTVVHVAGNSNKSRHWIVIEEKIELKNGKKITTRKKKLGPITISSTHQIE
jgi:phage shock protein PspC (stress-responsive transcriptional regulator)